MASRSACRCHVAALEARERRTHLPQLAVDLHRERGHDLVVLARRRLLREIAGTLAAVRVDTRAWRQFVTQRLEVGAYAVVSVMWGPRARDCAQRAPEKIKLSSRQRRASRRNRFDSVIRPTRLPSVSTTGRPPILCSSISSAAWPTVSLS